MPVHALVETKGATRNCGAWKTFHQCIDIGDLVVYVDDVGSTPSRTLVTSLISLLYVVEDLVGSRAETVGIESPENSFTCRL